MWRQDKARGGKPEETASLLGISFCHGSAGLANKLSDADSFMNVDLIVITGPNCEPTPITNG